MPRSRNGCATCKKRHRKCDEAKPTCYECSGNGLQCEGYQVKLQWDVGVASRGLLRGATVPVTQSASSLERYEVADLIHGPVFSDSNAWINKAPLPLGGGSLGQPVATHVASANAVASSDEMRQLFKECKSSQSLLARTVQYLWRPRQNLTSILLSSQRDDGYALVQYFGP